MNCFMCELSRDIFEKNGLDFKKHKNSEHSLWKYLFYIVSLNQQVSTDLDGTEQYVMNCLKERNYQWIPNREAFTINKKLKEVEVLDAIEDKETDSPGKSEYDGEKSPGAKARAKKAGEQIEKMNGVLDKSSKNQKDLVALEQIFEGNVGKIETQFQNLEKTILGSIEEMSRKREAFMETFRQKSKGIEELLGKLAIKASLI